MSSWLKRIWKDLRVNTLTTLVISVIVIMFGLISFQTYRVTSDLKEDVRLVNHTLVVLEELAQLRSLVARVESEVRGFILTSDPNYLTIEPVAWDWAQSAMTGLDSLVTGVPEQSARMQRLRPLVIKRIERAQYLVALYRSQGQQAAILRVRSNEGKTLSDSINAILDEAVTLENELLGVRSQRSELRTSEARTTLRIGAASLLLLVAGGSLMVNRLIVRRHEAELKARSSEAQILTILESVPVGILVLSANGTPFFMNDAAQRILGKGLVQGLKPDQLSATYNVYVSGTETRYPPERMPIVKALHGERSTVADIEIDREGNRIALVISATPIYDSAGALIYALSAFTDVSEQRRIQNELGESEQRFRHLVETATDIIYRTDENGYFTFVNPVGLRIFGYTEREVTSLRFTDVVRADAREKVRRFYLRQAIDKTETTYFEFPVVTRDRSHLIIGQNVTLLGTKDHITGFHAVARDVTEERLAKESLARRENQLNTVIETVDEGITFSDEDGKFEIFNRKFEELTGYTKDDANAADDFSTLIQFDKASHQLGLDRLREVLHKGSIRDIETVIRTKSGELKTLSVSTRLVLQQHRRMFLSVYSDITERKRTFEQLQTAMEAANTATQAKSDFLATMSHEIRTPMNGVIGMTDVLLQTELTAEQLEYVETIRTSGEALLTVINDILDYSKIESGKLTLESQPFDLVECIEDVYDILSYKAREKNLDLLYMIDQELPRTIVGDVSRMRQILLNLVGNAVKFTHRGEVLTQVKKIGIVGDILELQIDVRDTGMGIPKDRQNQLFESFTQLDSSTTRRFGGTGLGLAISRRLVALMGGRIWLKSEEGLGSTFSFTLRAHVTPEVAHMATKYVHSLAGYLAGKRVLLVDDNLTNLEILKLHCTSWGMVPALTSDPKEAIGWIERGDRFDIGIFDMQMPVMNGLQLAHVVRRTQPKFKLPLILLTSVGSQAETAEDILKFFTASVTKPIRESQLLEVMSSALSGRSMTERRDRRANKSESPLALRMPLKILVAEDNAVNQKLILRLLEKLGYAATLSIDGKEAVAKAAETWYDIILMDVHMPEMDGLEATREILKTSLPDKKPVIIALTAGVLQEDKDRCANAGMIDFLSKPIHLTELQVVLERWGSAFAEALPVEEDPTSIEPHLLVRLRQLCDETETEFVHTLVTDYIPDVEERVGLLKDLLSGNKLEQLRQSAHALKGGALNMGARTLADMFGRLQKSVEDKKLDDLTSQIGMIAAHWKLARKEFEQYLSSSAPRSA